MLSLLLKRLRLTSMFPVVDRFVVIPIRGHKHPLTEKPREIIYKKTINLKLSSPLVNMNTTIPSTYEIEVHPLLAEPRLQRQTTEPTITHAEDHGLIGSSKCDTSFFVSSRAMNPSKPTSFRNRIQITKPEMAKYFDCPQRFAAQKLGVSLSTLKRRFYQLGIGRWPYQLAQDKRRRSIWFLVNKEESKSEKELSPGTVQTLNQLFSMTLQEQQFLATQNPFKEGSVSVGTRLHYVPMSETSRSQTHNSSISPFPSHQTKEFKRDIEGSCNWERTHRRTTGETYRTRQTLSGSGVSSD